jgi:hypothetical protein
LLIGIADYKNFAPPPGEPGHTDLHGPGNDVERMRVSLRRFGFAGDSNVRVLRDAAASRQGIAAGFRWLAERATDSADVVVVFYSGHGSRVRDLNGDEARTTPGDSTDEALVPWDAASTADPQQLVLDDQIGEWLARLRTANVTMIVDGCFSGTMTRGLGSIVAKGTFGDAPAGSAPSPRQLLDNPAHTLITASAPGQTAYEMPFGPEHRWFGAFTYELTRALDAAGPTARYDEIMRDVTRGIRENHDAPQLPQLEGDRSALLFRVREAVARRAFVLVAPLAGNRVTIDAGAVHGVRRLAVYDVFAPGETTFAGPSLGQISIDSIAETVSWGQALGGVAFPAGARATLAQLPRGAERVEALRLYIAPAAAAMRPSVESLHFVRLVDSAHADAQLSASRAGGFEVTLAGATLPPLDTEGGSEEVCPRLARAFAIKAFDAIDNPAAPLSWELNVRFVESSASVPDDGSELDTLYIGRTYDLYVQVRAGEGEQLYLTAASQGFTGPPALIYPDPSQVGPNQPFAALNQWVRILNGLPASEPPGLEVVKLLLGTDQYDFRTLMQTLPACTPVDVREASPPPPAIRWRAGAHRVMIVRDRTP